MKNTVVGFFTEHEVKGTVPGTTGNSEKQNKVVLGVRSLIICVCWGNGAKRKHKKTAIQNKF